MVARGIFRDIIEIVIVLAFIVTIMIVASQIIENEKKNSSTSIVELNVVDKQREPKVIYTGKTAVTTTAYYLLVEFGEEEKRVPITSSIYNEIDVPCSALFTIYYNSENELIDIELER